jgi:hypothetical protein
LGIVDTGSSATQPPLGTITVDISGYGFERDPAVILDADQPGFIFNVYNVSTTSFSVSAVRYDGVIPVFSIAFNYILL